ncbi:MULTISPECIES: helix-turn-helix domain-containing protein [unclassified Paraburkholderia]|uniref:TetR/AcrR family transcriptional regulator n=1 Tax=unclassified Paraburkholderia TaxID=2615204 RepID=UPI002AB08FD6|nr:MULTISPECIES: helix-turn-helix domain-containing protein [unclassified Paraburkholderia]
MATSRRSTAAPTAPTAAKKAPASKRAPAKRAQASKAGDATETSKAAPRINERARARTRGKLLQAARMVMGQKGISGTAINDITEQAGVAFGSFYNYFSTKDEIARAVFVEDMLAIADLLDRIRPADADIAVIVGLNVRQVMRHTLDDPIWGWFFVNAASSVSDLIETMGGRLARDIRIGVDAGRFHCADVLAAMDCIIGGALHVMRQILEKRRTPETVDRFTEFALRGLGIRDADVAGIMKEVLRHDELQVAASASTRAA